MGWFEGPQFVFLTPGGGNKDNFLFRQSTAKKNFSASGLKMAFKPQFFKYREVHDAEFIVFVHEIVGLIGTNIVW